jgi:pimeloyl-ACP methyl ester carboxylesterase
MPRCVVLVHGLWLSGWSLVPLARRLRAAGFRVGVFSYPTARGSFDAHAAALAAFLQAQPEPVAGVVGHSLGGLVALRALELTPAAGVERLLLLGSPVRGSRAADALARLPGGRALAGPTLAQALQRGPRRPSQPVVIGMIAGSVGMGAGRLVTRFPGPGDGAVSLEETCWEGLDARLVLPVNHFGLLVSARVARSAARFLHTGRLEAA